MKILTRISTFLQKLRAHPGRTLRILNWNVWGTLAFGAIKWHRSPVYMTYHPYSSYVYNTHPEMHCLIKKWVKSNRRNNGGDITRLYALILNIKQTLGDGIGGHFAELGVWRGNSAAVLAYYAAQHARRVHLFDTFEGFDSRDLRGIDAHRSTAFHDTSIARVKNLIGNEQVADYVQGYFPQSIPAAMRTSRYAFVSLDCDLYEPMSSGLEFFYARMDKGGTLFIHDYSSGYWEGAKRAVDEFCVANGEAVVLIPDTSGTAVVRKSRA